MHPTLNIFQMKKCLASPPCNLSLHCFVRLTHPSDCGLTKLSEGDLYSPLVQHPTKKYISRKLAGNLQQWHYANSTHHYMYKKLPSCKVLQTPLNTFKQQITWFLHPAANRNCSLYSLKESWVTFFVRCHQLKGADSCLLVGRQDLYTPSQAEGCLFKRNKIKKNKDK